MPWSQPTLWPPTSHAGDTDWTPSTSPRRAPSAFPPSSAAHLSTPPARHHGRRPQPSAANRYDAASAAAAAGLDSAPRHRDADPSAAGSSASAIVASAVGAAAAAASVAASCKGRIQTQQARQPRSAAAIAAGDYAVIVAGPGRGVPRGPPQPPSLSPPSHHAPLSCPPSVSWQPPQPSRPALPPPPPPVESWQSARPAGGAENQRPIRPAGRERDLNGELPAAARPSPARTSAAAMERLLRGAGSTAAPQSRPPHADTDGWPQQMQRPAMAAAGGFGHGEVRPLGDAGGQALYRGDGRGGVPSAGRVPALSRSSSPVPMPSDLAHPDPAHRPGRAGESVARPGGHAVATARAGQDAGDGVRRGVADKGRSQAAERPLQAQEAAAAAERAAERGGDPAAGHNWSGGESSYGSGPAYAAALVPISAGEAARRGAAGGGRGVSALAAEGGTAAGLWAMGSSDDDWAAGAAGRGAAGDEAGRRQLEEEVARHLRETEWLVSTRADLPPPLLPRRPSSPVRTWERCAVLLVGRRGA